MAHQNQNSNQNSDKQKSNTNPKQNKSKKKLFCHYHKENISHTSKDCYVLKRNKNINKAEGCESDDDHSDNNDSNNGLTVFNKITAVTPYIKSFTSLNDTHPMVTTKPLLTKLNIENFAHVTFEVDTAASHSVISKSNFDKHQNLLKIRGKRP